MEIKNFLQNLSEAIEHRKLDTFDLISQMMEVKEFNEFEQNLSSISSEINFSDFLCKNDISENSQLTTGIQQFNKGFLSLENFRRGHIDGNTLKKNLVYYRSAAIVLPEFGDFIKVYHIQALMELKDYDDIYNDFSFNFLNGLTEKGINDIVKTISLFTLAATALMLLSCNPLLKKSALDTGNTVTNDNQQEHYFDIVNPLNNGLKSFNAIEGSRPVFDEDHEYIPFSETIKKGYPKTYIKSGFLEVQLNEKKDLGGEVHHKGFIRSKGGAIELPINCKEILNPDNKERKVHVEVIQRF